MHLKHHPPPPPPPPPFGDSCSAYALNTRTHFVAPVHHIIYYLNPPPHPIWRFWFPMYLRHGLSCGDSGSEYTLNTPAHLAAPVHPASVHHNPIGRFRFITYLKHAPAPPPPLGPFRFTIAIPQTPPLLHTPPHWAIPVHQIS